MKKIYLLFVLFILVNANLMHAQNYLWAKGPGGTETGSHRNGNNVRVNHEGNIFCIGEFSSNLIILGTDTIINEGGLTGTSDVFLVKYDSSGTVIWAKGIGGPKSESGYGLSIDNEGNVIITGAYCSPTMVLNGITLVNSDNTGATSDIYIAKYDSAGNILWAKSEGAIGNDVSYNVCNDGAGNIMIIGYFSEWTLPFETEILTAVNIECTLIAKFDPSGNFLWVRNPESNYQNLGNGICTDHSNNIYITGSNYGTSDGGDIVFGNDTLINAGVFVVKYDTSGNELWAIGDHSTWGEGYSICTDLHDNVLFTGFHNAYAFVLGGDTLLSNGAEDIFIGKLDSSGNYLWTKGVGGADPDFGASISTDLNDNVVIAGDFLSTTIPFGNVTLHNTDTTTAWLADIFVAKYDEYGNALWAKGIGTLSDDNTRAVCTDMNGNIILTGSYQGDSLKLGTIKLVSHYLSDYFITKISSSPTLVWPGDTDNDSIVNNIDLLQIGLHFGQTGIPRDSVSNTWQAYPVNDWGSLERGGYDIKHVDCNGDGVIDDNDTLAINLNYSLMHAIRVVHDDARVSLPEIYFVTAASSYSAGQPIDVEVWMGTAMDPIPNLYGISMNIGYNALLVELGTEVISYPPGWIGTPGTNAITISKVDPLTEIAYGGIVRTDHINGLGFGKIADFKFKLKNSIVDTDSMHFYINDYTAVDAVGNSLSIHDTPLAIQVTPETTGINEATGNVAISIYPNPYSAYTTISYSLIEKSVVTIEIYNKLGEKEETIVDALQIEGMHKYQFSAKEKGLNAGVYFVKITVNGKVTVKKIVEI